MSKLVYNVFENTITGLSLLEHQTLNSMDKQSILLELVTKSGVINI